MPTRKSPRKGSLQFWPRKRAKKFLPRANWEAINSDKPLKGFICYKAGMVSVAVKDTTPHSMTKDKKIVIPATILECPPMKILSIRFYKNSKVVTEVMAEGLDKELKKVLKLPKKTKKIDGIKPEIYDNIKVIVYSIVKKTKLKKTPDVIEVGINGTIEEKLNFVKENLGKELSILSFFEKGELIDLRGLTKGKGLQGPVKRFGINLKSHKSEKGVRRPGSLGPWHPARVTFRTPQAGQLGMFTRVVYNNKIIDLGKKNETVKNIKNYGEINSEYILVKGSVQGPSKRQLLLTQALRETKKQKKKEYEFIELR
ncbi:50S ribosomal protein L3 [archaeon]|nr:50S ribosomal protein L3 [archaeon]PJC45211.1 MAG: 50S ribosomal protein L3 [Candidatus Pacearchaeota archaeon CG_4_9_14_0_2_um_filter_30_8]